jgi:hypothetical protein
LSALDYVNRMRLQIKRDDASCYGDFALDTHPTRRQDMPDRNQRQDSGGRKDQIQNPGTFSPDDDEAQESDITRATGERTGEGRKRAADQQPITETDEEEAEDTGDDDEDDADGIGARSDV